MTEEELVYFLKNHKNIRKSIVIIKQKMYFSIETAEDIIKQIFLSEYKEKKKEEKINTIYKKIEITEEYQQIQAEYIKNVKESLYCLATEEICLNTIFLCICKMREPERSILILLYIQNEKWDSVCNILQISSTRLCRIRRIALNYLLEIYEKILKQKENEFIREGESLLIQKFLQSSQNKTEIKQKIELNIDELRNILHTNKKSKNETG